MYIFLHITVFFFTLVKSKASYLHMGRALAVAVQGSRLTKEVVARKAGYTRSAYYKHVQQHDLSYHILAKYGRALEYDFTNEFPDMPPYMQPGNIHEDNFYNNASARKEPIQENQEWRSKFFELLGRLQQIVRDFEPKE